jgi:hypothetical protein
MNKELALVKLQELDQRLVGLSVSLKAKEMEKIKFEDKHKAILAVLDSFRQEIKQLKLEIEAVKAEMLTQYILGNIEQPFLGARHSIRTVKDVEVINKSLVPEDYKDVNLVMIRRDVLNRNIIIPGIQVIEKKIIAFK